MAKIKDIIEYGVIDTYKEHKFHQEYHLNCLDCKKEERARQTSHQDLLKKYPALQNPHGSNYPIGYRPN